MYINGVQITGIQPKPIELTQAEYDALPEIEKQNGCYIITDAVSEPFNAENVGYDNTSSGLVATDVQAAIDELAEGGGGGGGGHTIVNDSGTSMTQRSDLQFNGVYTSDNSTDNTTEVNIVREMTEAEYSQLSADEKKGIIVTDASTPSVIGLTGDMVMYDSTSTVNDIIEKNNSKNLLPIPYYTIDTNSYWSTDNNGAISITSGTASERYLKYLTYHGKKFTLPAGRYKLSKGIETPNTSETIGIVVDACTGNGWVKNLAKSTTPDEVEFEVDYDGYDRIEVFMNVDSGAVVPENTVLYPMIRAASDNDSTFEPYYMSNKELTDNVLSNALNTSVLSQSTPSAPRVSNLQGGLIRKGSIVYVMITFTAQVSHTSSPSILKINDAAYYPKIDAILNCATFDVTAGDVGQSLGCAVRASDGYIYVKELTNGVSYTITGSYIAK